MPKRPLIAINCDYEPASSGYRMRGRATVFMPYVEAVAEAGGLPLLIPPSRPEVLKHYVDIADGFVFTGGRDYPPELYGEKPRAEVVKASSERTENDRQLMRLVLRSSKPALGICAGLQLMNIVDGGALIQHLETAPDHVAKHEGLDAAHPVTIAPGTRLKKLFKAARINVNSAHHQAADPQRLGKGLKVAARAADGTIEALELQRPQRRFFLFVQWHPERIPDAAHRRTLFKALIKACRRS